MLFVLTACVEYICLQLLQPQQTEFHAVWRELSRSSRLDCISVSQQPNRTTKPWQANKGVSYIIPVDHKKLFCRSRTH